MLSAIYAECCANNSFILSIILLNVVILSVVPTLYASLISGNLRGFMHGIILFLPMSDRHFKRESYTRLSQEWETDSELKWKLRKDLLEMRGKGMDKSRETLLKRKAQYN